MNSIELLREDFNLQPAWLNKIKCNKISDECIFVGSGDSYAAGLAAEYATDHRSICYSPSDLFDSQFKDKSRTYCFISVTGKTQANIKVARRAVESGARTVAVTFNKSSQLAQTCEELITIGAPSPQTPTAGFGTFVANLLACLQIVGKPKPQEIATWHGNAVNQSKEFVNSIKFPKGESVYLLGNNMLYATALYSSFQLAEFFGISANAYKFEEFCHSPIFGAKKSDNIWVLGQNESSIGQRIAALGNSVSYFEFGDKDYLAQLFESIFFVQSLILLLAKKYGCTELQYVLMKDVLQASSDIIY